jgi:hypothetical protein
MSSIHVIDVQPETFAAAEAVAAEKQMGVEAILDAAMNRGLDLFRQELFFQERLRRAEARGATLEDAYAIVARAGKGNAPDPGDEMPDDLKHLSQVG